MKRFNLSGSTDIDHRRSTATAFGALLTGVLGGRRTDQPVRRNSYDVDDPRLCVFWRSVPRWFRRRQLGAAEQYDRAGRQQGDRNGPLGHVALEVLRVLNTIVDWRTGRLDPSLAWICAKTRRSKDAVVRALRRLAQHGFVEWMRRSERIEDAQGAGPRIKQASNAYRLTVPQALLAAYRAPPPPADDAWRRRTAESDTAEMVRSLSPAQYVELSITDDGLRSALLALDRAMSASHPSVQNPA